MTITFTLNPAFTGATYVAGPYNISGTTCPGNTYLLASGVTKNQLITGHTINTGYENLTGGTIASEGVCAGTTQPWTTGIVCTGATSGVTAYTYFRASEILDTDLSTTYCLNAGSGGQGYIMSQAFYSADATLVPGSSIIYTNPGLTTLDTGTFVPGSNITRMAYITGAEEAAATYQPTTTDPDGDGTFSGGVYKYMRVDVNGQIQSLGTHNCIGGGGGGGGSEV